MNKNETYEIWSGASRFDMGLDMTSAIDNCIQLERLFPGGVFDIIRVTREVVSSGLEMRRVG